MNQRSRTIASIQVFILALIPIVLWILPVDFFDEGKSICLSQLLFDLECYACGMTRSIMYIMHFDFAEAFYHNFLGFIVFPFLVYVWFGWIKKPLRYLGIFRSSLTN
jgi:hypothetical protein